LFEKEADNVWSGWKGIDRKLKEEGERFQLKELPYKNEILNIVHKKRNFVQHSGETPGREEAVRYLTYTKLFINQVTKEILDVDMRSLSAADIIQNKFLKLLVEKAFSHLGDNPELAGALVGCALFYTTESHRAKGNEINDILGHKAIKYFSKEALRGDGIAEIFSGIGKRIASNTKAIEKIIEEGCNPPKEVLQNLPSGFLAMNHSFSIRRVSGATITEEDVRQALSFAVRYIHKLESLDLLPHLPFDLEEGITFEGQVL
jgi:hypothetical protein